MVTAKLATTPPVSVPELSLVATPVRVATPLLSVGAVPTETPSRVNVTVWLASGLLVTLEVSVAVNVAVPPLTAVPEILVTVVAAWATTRLPGC